MGTGQSNVKAYNRRLMDLIHHDKANPSFIISHELPLAEAPNAYKHFDNRDEGWTKVSSTPTTHKSENAKSASLPSVSKILIADQREARASGPETKRYSSHEVTASRAGSPSGRTTSATKSGSTRRPQSQDPRTVPRSWCR
ncbi:hypothetical protein HDF12_002715 [Edaphobacter lichenicola]|uniref:Uncharacterized protein n=1 Tax=Tunturiibacter lichenicola TaxID=2051959 RepID=A0A7Y9T3F3_9BACT|nr:hypothetical protein [Edaphobacter lichenicola]